MGWKNFPYWLKGVIIAITIGIIQIVAFLFCYLRSNSEGCMAFFLPSGMIYNIVYQVTSLADMGFFFSQSIRAVFYYFTYIIFLSIIGAIIGWIVGRIKSKK